jgi:maltose O-acetyltransferase
MNMRSGVLYIYALLSSILPPTRLFGLKVAMLRAAGATIGSNVRVASSARFHLEGALSIGDGCWIGEDVLMVGGKANLSIGPKCDIAPRVTLVLGSHILWETTDRAAGSGVSRPIEIGAGVWIGAGSTVLGGVRIGDCAMIAAGSVVTVDVERYTMVAGVPAVAVRRCADIDEHATPTNRRS